MSRQSLIENFFKYKANPSTSSQKLDVKDEPSISVMKIKKKRNLSLVKPNTPAKSPKVSDKNKLAVDVIYLSSDDEDIWENTPKSRVPLADLSQRSTDSEGVTSDCSANTVLYSPSSFQSPSTPRKLDVSVTSPKTSPCTSQVHVKSYQKLESTPISNLVSPASNQTPIKIDPRAETFQSPINHVTPHKSPQSALQVSSQSSDTYKTPQRKEKFFSPTKKRSVVKKIPSRVKRSLSMEISKTLPNRILFEEDIFAAACEGMDDKTIFLLQIINKYLNTPSLKDLLDTEATKLLSNCLQVVKPGSRLVCRLFWRKEGWYKKDQVAQICSDGNEALSDTDFQAMMNSLLVNGLVLEGRVFATWHIIQNPVINNAHWVLERGNRLVLHAKETTRYKAILKCVSRNALFNTEYCSTQNMTFDDLAAVLNKDELKQICKELKQKMNSKQDAIAALRNFSKRSSNISSFLTGYKSCNSRRVLNMMNSKVGPSFKLSDVARCTLHKLHIIMYLGMDYSIIREKRLEFILLYDKIKRETYPIDKDMTLDDASVVFRTRDEFERYVTALNIYEDYMTRTDVTEKCNIVKQVYSLYKEISEEEMSCYRSLPQWLQRYTPASLYVKILETGIQELKKEKTGGHFLLALNVLSTLINQTTFRQHRKAEWYAEKALILHNCLSRHDEAAEVLLEGFKSNLSEEAKDHMRQRAKKIANQKNAPVSEHLKKELSEYATKDAILENNLSGKHIEKQPMERLNKRGKVKFETRTPEGKMVQDAEEFCIAHYLYTKEFTDGEHWEGRIVTSLFFLLFWDIIYTKPAGVRGVFLSYYQMVPLDLYTDGFYTNRKEIIDDWLSAIASSSEDKLLSIMHETWSNRPSYELSPFSRGGISWDHLKAVASCLGPAGLAAICRRLATNYCYAHSGFPDLTLWHTRTRRIKFVEVKTDTDKPSMKQIQWMQYLQSHEIETEFCYVGVNTTRQRSRTKNIDITVKTEL